MSLINKMLRDLETRQNSGVRAQRPIFQDLHAAHHETPHQRRILIIALVLLLAGITGIYAWDRWNNNPVAVVASPTSATPLAQAPVVSEPVKTLVPVAEVAVAATAATTPTAPVVPKNSKQDETGVRAASKKPTAARPVEPAPSALLNETNSESATGPARIEKTDRPYSALELAESAYREAIRLRAQGDASGAERRTRAALASDPKHIKARELLAGLQLESGRWLEAQDTLEHGIAQSPTHLPFRFQLARLHLERAEPARALSVLEAARGPAQTDPELPAFLAALYQRSGRNADAVKSYQEALAVRPQEGRWWVGLGISLEAEKNSEAARTAYRHALDTGRLPPNLAQYAEARLKVLVVR